MSLAKFRPLFLAPYAAALALLAVQPASAVQPQIDAASRMATFQNAESTFFALSVLSDPTGSYPQADAFEVAILVDTSATQTGPIRIESLEVVSELAKSLPSTAKVSLLACDIDTVALTAGMVSSQDSQFQQGLEALQKRIPLGTTNLGKALSTAAAQFSQTPAQKTIVYVGDGVNRSHFLSSAEHRQLVDGLVDRQITVSSLAIGPVVDVANLAALANHTGGILLSRNEIAESAQTIGHSLGNSCTMPVVWIEQTEMPAAIEGHFPQQFPPLRVDRDTIVIGRLSGEMQAGPMVLKGATAGQEVTVRASVSAESNNPDLGFLAHVVSSASQDGGLTLPALGSDGLRAMSFVLADSATSLVKSGQFALKSGEVESAIRIAEQALKNDPNNAEATNLLNAAKKMAESEVKIPTGKFTQYTPADGALSGVGDLLLEEEQQRQLMAQALQASIEDQLRGAQRVVKQDPTGVKNSLKLLLEELDSAVDVDATTRAQLRNQVSSMIKVSAVEEARYLDRMQRGEVVRAQAAQAERLLAETNRRDEGLKRLVERFNSLMATQRYHEANKDVQPAIGDAAPDSVLDYVTREESSLAANYQLVKAAFEAREMGFVDVMTAVEEAAVPFAGDPPIVYPPPEVWQALTARRKERYGAINLAGGNEAESKIYAALKQPYSPDFTGTALQNIMDTLADDLDIPIYIDTPELELLAIDADTPVSLSLPEISVRSMLRLILDPLDLTYIIRNEVLTITSKDSAESEPINKVYPVGDLVVPPMPMGGMMGGGMMGGGMGGMGGGMGGMGGGMGGMGGGMGGMGGGMGGMGGMGGGMFVVPDDSSKSVPSAASSRKSPAEFIERLENATEEELAKIEAEIRRFVQDRVSVAEAYLEANDQAAAKQEFEKVITLLGDLLCAGYPQPWMYHALSLSMEACEYPASEIQRVLMSSLDFEGNPDDSVRIAGYLARNGMPAAALELLRDVAIVQPHRYDAFALALPLARETRDFEALRWVCVGILSKAWPKEHAQLYQQAELLAKVTSARLAQEGRVVEAKAFAEEIESSKLRDIAVRVTWTGDADLDIRVKEPPGTVCSLTTPQTASGGVLLGDTSSSNEAASIDGFSEYYVCAKGYAGQYDVLIRRIYGEVAGGKVTVEIFTDFGSPEQTHIVKQIELSDEGAMVNVAVKNGHRSEPIAAAHLAQVEEKREEVGRAVLGQFGGLDSSSAADYANLRNSIAAARRFGFGFPVGGGAVGYRPVITNLQEGASMTVTGVVSADRRYVRISPSPFFNGIGEIFTFNFVDGTTGAGGAGGAGGGLGGAGGGGLGGAGGGAGGGGFGF